MKTRKLCAVKKPIRSTSETAFQRALLRRQKCSFYDLGEVSWIDIELPVNKGRKSGRGECVDLIGKCDQYYVLCELKFKKGSSNSNPPQDAINELDNYCKQISENWEELERLNLHHKDCDTFLWEDIAKCINSGTIIKIIAANSDYWDYWLKHRYKLIKVDIDNIKNREYLLYSMDVDGNYFSSQKKDSEYYLPKLSDQTWNLV